MVERVKAVASRVSWTAWAPASVSVAMFILAFFSFPREWGRLETRVSEQDKLIARLESQGSSQVPGMAAAIKSLEEKVKSVDVLGCQPSVRVRQDVSAIQVTCEALKESMASLKHGQERIEVLLESRRPASEQGE
jgi:hypothetical protein